MRDYTLSHFFPDQHYHVRTVTEPNVPVMKEVTALPVPTPTVSHPIGAVETIGGSADETIEPIVAGRDPPIGALQLDESAELIIFAAPLPVAGAARFVT